MGDGSTGCQLFCDHRSGRHHQRRIVKREETRRGPPSRYAGSQKSIQQLSLPLSEDSLFLLARSEIVGSICGAVRPGGLLPNLLVRESSSEGIRVGDVETGILQLTTLKVYISRNIPRILPNTISESAENIKELEQTSWCTCTTGYNSGMSSSQLRIASCLGPAFAT